MKAELRILLLSKRSMITLILLVAAVSIIQIQLKTMSTLGVFPSSGFSALEMNLRIVLNLILPVLVIVESVFWFGKPFTDGTLQWSFFAGLPRKKHWGSRMRTFALRLFLQWLIIVVISILFFVFLWGGKDYPLEFGNISATDQIARYLFAAGAALCLNLVWSAFVFAITIGFSGKRFETGLISWILFIIFQITVIDTMNGPLSIFGGIFKNYFLFLNPSTNIAVFAGSTFVLLSAIYLLLIILGNRLYQKTRLSPQERLS